MRRRGLLVVLSGPAGSGKTTLARNLVRQHPDIQRAITATTRQPRADEIDGRDYYFLAQADFQKKIAAGYFVEHAEFNGNLYGTPKAELERHLGDGKVVLLVIDVQGAQQMHAKLPHGVFVFVLPPSHDVLRQRLAGRATERVADIQERLAIAEREIECLEDYRYLIINDDETAATGELLAIITLARAHRIRGGEREAWLNGDYEGWHDIADKT